MQPYVNNSFTQTRLLIETFSQVSDVAHGFLVIFRTLDKKEKIGNFNLIRLFVSIFGVRLGFQHL